LQDAGGHGGGKDSQSHFYIHSDTIERNMLLASDRRSI
jgi:hypothetical protein